MLHIASGVHTDIYRNRVRHTSHHGEPWVSDCLLEHALALSMSGAGYWPQLIQRAPAWTVWKRYTTSNHPDTKVQHRKPVPHPWIPFSPVLWHQKKCESPMTDRCSIGHKKGSNLYCRLEISSKFNKQKQGNLSSKKKKRTQKKGEWPLLNTTWIITAFWLHLFIYQPIGKSTNYYLSLNYVDDQNGAIDRSN